MSPKYIHLDVPKTSQVQHDIFEIHNLLISTLPTPLHCKFSFQVTESSSIIFHLSTCHLHARGSDCTVKKCTWPTPSHPPTLHRALPPVPHSFKHKPDPFTVPLNTFRDSHQLKSKLELYFMTIKALYNLVPAPFQWQFSFSMAVLTSPIHSERHIFLSKIFSLALTSSTKQIPTHFHRFKYHLIFTTFS